ncbi:4820_t:CDS:2 [Acaulospora colombiana]|uniref:4820_t:CDS:1 n=1 Tax=Acaulospora colombiana TaxID=27376 RepID=A0ACA9KFD5_9GLOM|nr:4820_t:CDS:2 [Acaulospora colombiana]
MIASPNMKSFFILFVVILTCINSIVNCHYIPSSHAKNSIDACKEIHDKFLQTNATNSTTWEEVAACYRSFPYDSEVAKETIETLRGFLSAFYAFFDEAKEEPKPGFTFRPVDLAVELDRLLENKYEVEFDFYTDVKSVINALSDAHTQLTGNCYESFLFDQGLSLYSIIRDGKQIIKVFNDSVDPSNINCEVVSIDGLPALDVINKFALDQVGLTKDLGVRFNLALASLSLSRGVLQASDFSGLFTSRQQLPPTPYISYTLNCSGDWLKQVNRRWTVGATRAVLTNFTDSVSYRKQFCVKFNNSTDKNTNANSVTKSAVHTHRSKREIDVPSLSEGELIVDAIIASFYVVRDVGVAVISTIDTSTLDQTQMEVVYTNLYEGFQSFAKRKIKKVVLDLSNNGGGTVEVSQYIALLLFPDIIPSFPLDMRLSDLYRLAIKTASVIPSPVPEFPFDYHGYIRAENEQNFTSVQQFFGNNMFTRGGIQNNYSSKFFINYESELRKNLESVQGSNPSPLNWTRDNIIILTNGFCGSACANLAQILAEKKQIKTVAVGGLLSQNQLSYASFPGGFKLDSGDVFSLLNDVGLNHSSNSLVPNDFSLSMSASAAGSEVYSSVHNTMVMEFEFKPSDFRLFYDEKSARDPSILWMQAAELIGK